MTGNKDEDIKTVPAEDATDQINARIKELERKLAILTPVDLGSIRKMMEEPYTTLIDIPINRAIKEIYDEIKGLEQQLEPLKVENE